MKKLIFASLLIFGFIPNFSYAYDTASINTNGMGQFYGFNCQQNSTSNDYINFNYNQSEQWSSTNTNITAYPTVAYWIRQVIGAGNIPEEERLQCKFDIGGLGNYYGNGIYLITLHINSGTYTYQFTRTAGSWIPIEYIENTSTRLISLTPLNNSTTSNPVTFTLQAYVAPKDIGTYIGVKFWLHNIDQNTILGGLTQYFNNNDIYLLDGFNATTSGYFNYSTTTVLAEGNYRINAQIKRSYLGGWIVNPLSSINDEWNNQFIVGKSTFIGNISQNSFGLLNDTLASSTGTIGTNCNPIKASDTFGFTYNASSSITSCLAYLLIPDTGQLQTILTDFKDNVATHFPLGYVTDFLLTMSTTSTTSLNIIDVQIPEGMAGTGATLKLDITHVFDPILNAKVDKFIYKNSAGIGQIATSTTLYEYTSFWWEMIIYILAGLYLLARILGMHLFDINFGSHGSLSDNSNKDDSYKLKTWLANNDSRGYIDINGKRYETQKQRKK
jgi:hypothetical protein